MIKSLMEHDLDKLKASLSVKLSEQDEAKIQMFAANYALAAIMDSSICREAEQICLEQGG